MYKLDFTQILKKLNVFKERRDNFILNLVNLQKNINCLRQNFTLKYFGKIIQNP